MEDITQAPAVTYWKRVDKAHDEMTVAALAWLLRKNWGQAPASIVGRLYNGRDGDVYRSTIHSYGGVSKFVSGHSDMFAWDPPLKWSSCNTIRLLTDLERLSARASARNEERLMADEQTPCKYFQRGQCMRGASCKFSHKLASPSDSPASHTSVEGTPAVSQPPVTVHKGRQAEDTTNQGVQAEARRDTGVHWRLLCCGRRSIAQRLQQQQRECQQQQQQQNRTALAAQVLYYLSDKNLRRDAFFQSAIAGNDGWLSLHTIMACRRIQDMNATLEDLLAAIDWFCTCGDEQLPVAAEEALQVELRRSPPGSEAVRRRRPPPPLEETWPPIDRPLSQPPATSSRPPPTLISSCAPGWTSMIEDTARRSYFQIRRNTWPMDLLSKEFEVIRSSTVWNTLTNKKEEPTRSTSWYVSEGCTCSYSYGEITVEPSSRPAWLRDIEARVLGEGCGLPESEWPNCVNMNLYETDDQNVGWHSDNEVLFCGAERYCRIISASWGVPRQFEVALQDKNRLVNGRPTIFQDTIRRVALLPGDLCAMEGLFQKYYSHQLSKGPTSFESPLPRRVRVNLTWRYIQRHRHTCPMAHR